MDLSTDAPLDDAGSMASAALALTTDGEVIFSGAWGDLSPRLTPRRPALSVSPLPPRPTRPRLRPAPRAARDRIPHACAAPSPLSGALQEARALYPALRGHCSRQRPGPAPRTTIVVHRPTRRQADRQTGRQARTSRGRTAAPQFLVASSIAGALQKMKEGKNWKARHCSIVRPLLRCATTARRTLGHAAAVGFVAHCAQCARHAALPPFVPSFGPQTAPGGGRAVQRSVAWCKCAARCHTACWTFHKKGIGPG